ncbi:MAG TPA: GNAT family N-acetyltransferase [Xanthobacteraceae bacterium]|nr:GNAT family N-acetyltransferase [Xanthobacteraceae bacterium]
MLSIRPATLSDISAIARIYSGSVINGTATFELEPPTETEMAERMRHLLDAGFPYLTAEWNGAVAGYAYAAAYRIRPAYRFTVENSLYVSPTAQRRGVGRALLNTLIEESARRGFRQMIAVIGDSPNQLASVTLHKAAGFRVVGTLEDVGFKHGRWLDSLLMQRALGEGASSAPPEPGR